MKATVDESRRSFLKVAAAVGGGLLIGFRLPAFRALADVAQASEDAMFKPNAWIRIGSDNRVTIMVAHSEMGQGVMTALPILVADELDADWRAVHVENAPAAPAYFNPMTGSQLTGGSTSVRSSWQPLREAGATARAILVSAAAQRWRVDVAALRTERGMVIEKAGKRHATYGELAEAASKITFPHEVMLKKPQQYRLIGKPVARIDVPEKVNGSARFGIDMRMPGMLVAVVARCPVFGGKLASFDARKAKAIKGVRDVIAISSGVAVVADSFWPAKTGRDALEIKWDYGPNAKLSDAVIDERLRHGAERQGAVARSKGNAKAAMAGAAKRLEAAYALPYLAHATMEPINCTAHVRDGRCDVWVPTQAQTLTQQMAARVAGVPEKSVNVHTTFLGGGFGRRSETDFVADAVEISKAVKAPVKVIWTREDGIRHDFYRPVNYHRLHAALDAHGQPLAWMHRIVAPSILSRRFPDAVKHGVDRSSVEGAADISYAIPNIHVDYVMENLGVPVGFWRSVGHSFNTFVVESFVDELAHAAGKDPYEFRRGLLKGSPRLLGVLELAAEKSGWKNPPPHGVYRGLAVSRCYGSFVAEVAEVTMDGGGQPHVGRVVSAVDCGKFVNPDTIKAQIESATVYGLSAALTGRITIKGGRVQQANFNNYTIMRVNEMPHVEVHIVESGEAPGGIGEPGTAPIAPAVCNAIFAATGKRIRRLPIQGSKPEAA